MMNPWKTLSVMLAVTASMLVTASVKADAFIVKDGVAQAQIIVAKDQPRKTRLAAQELQAYIQKMSGAKLTISDTPSASIPNMIYVGQSVHTQTLGLEIDDLAHGAYRMVSGSNWLALFGPEQNWEPPTVGPWGKINRSAEYARLLSEWDALTGETFGNAFAQTYRMYYPTLDIWRYDGAGTLNAVHAFLYDQGVRWYMPGDIGEVIPEHKTIKLPEINKTSKPDFALRQLSYFYDHINMTDEETLWQFRMGVEAGADTIGTAIAAHGSKHVYIRPQMKEKHPEMYAIWNGKRAFEHARTGAPCLSSEILFEKHLEYIDDYFKFYPNEPIISLDMVDGYGYLCECDRCKVYGNKGNSWKSYLSEYVFTYINKVAKEVYKRHPDKMVSALAYSAYQEPPASIEQFSPNLALVYCQGRSTYDAKDIRDNTRNLRKAWLEKLPSQKIYIWEYYLESWPGRRPYEGIPTFYMHLAQEDIKSLKGVSNGDMIEVYRHRDASEYTWNAHTISSLNVYVTMRLLWDADLDLDALLNEYYTLFYGPVSSQMKTFVEYAEENWRSMRTDVNVINQALSLLAEAQKTVENKAAGSIYARRVELMVAYTMPLYQLKERLAMGRENNLEIRALTRRMEDFKLDGKLDDKIWAGARTQPMRELSTGRDPENATMVTFTWCDDSLVLGIRCEDRDIKNLNLTPLGNDDPNIFRRDSLEILIETQAHSYYQLVVSPTGALMDLDRDVVKNTKWSSGATVATHVGEGYWSAEIRIPAAGDLARDLNMLAGVAGRKPTTTYPWFLNVCRQYIRPHLTEHSAISPTGKADFHHVLKFAKLYVN